MSSADSAATRLATRLAFLVAGFGIACWAPLVPFAKQRLGIDDAALGLLLLCIGAGSVLAMTATGPLTTRHGSRPVILASGLATCVMLPMLALAGTPWLLGLALLVFGGALGCLDVAMNIHATEVEQAAGRPMMSGFHALFSIGGFAGSVLMTVLLSFHASALAGTLIGAGLMLAAMLVAAPRLLATRGAQDGPVFVRPRGVVLLLAALAAATFLAEGAMLDWSALLLITRGLAPSSQSGIGYILFATAMTAGRLIGDRVTARLGDRRTLIGGGSMAVAGFAVLLAAPVPWLALAGFLLIGLGASNIVPVLFRRAAMQQAMPASLAIGAITTTGYAGVLAGPAAVGFIAQATGLTFAFWILAGLIALVPLCARAVTPRA